MLWVAWHRRLATPRDPTCACGQVFDAPQSLYAQTLLAAMPEVPAQR